MIQYLGNNDFDDEPLLKKLCVLLCIPQNAPECAKIFLGGGGGACPDPPRVKDCREGMFSTSANDIAPLDGKSYAVMIPSLVMYRPNKPTHFHSYLKLTLCM